LNIHHPLHCHAAYDRHHGTSPSSHGKLPLLLHCCLGAAYPVACNNPTIKCESLGLIQPQVGTGEYTTGFVGGGASKSDKKVGVVGLTLFDLRRRGKVGKLSMVGTSGGKFPAIRTSPQQLDCPTDAAC